MGNTEHVDENRNALQFLRNKDPDRYNVREH